MGMTDKSLCNSCTNIGCEFQSGIVRTKCDFYMPPQLEPDNCGNYVIQEPTTKNNLGVDCISREQAKEAIRDKFKDLPSRVEINTILNELPSVTPQKPRKGEWLRMSDLSEQEDDRYKCSRCGNVIHYKDKMNLYTFNSWCGRCGSDNGRKIEVTV